MARQRKAKVAPAVDQNTSNLKAQANKVLDESRDKFDAVVVIGVVNNKDGLDINTNVPQYAWLHHVLQRTGFELLLHEKEEAMKRNVAVQEKV